MAWWQSSTCPLGIALQGSSWIPMVLWLESVCDLPSLLNLSIFSFIHFHSFSFIFIHFHLFSFIFIYFHLFSFILTYLYSFHNQSHNVHMLNAPSHAHLLRHYPTCWCYQRYSPLFSCLRTSIFSFIILFYLLFWYVR